MLKTIIEELKRDIEEAGLDVCNDVIFEQAVKIYLSNEINKAKNQRVSDMKSSIEKQTKDEPATSKQVYFIEKSTGSMVDKNLTKREASAWIKEIKGE